MSEVIEIDTEELKGKIIEAIQTVYDPEIPVNIFELGLIYEVSIFPVNNVFIQMTLTSPNCPAAQSMPAEVETKARAVEGVNEVTVEITFDPAWSQEMMSDAAKLELGFM
jgi:FeS assembly SUF system protein